MQVENLKGWVKDGHAGEREEAGDDYICEIKHLMVYCVVNEGACHNRGVILGGKDENFGQFC